MDHGHVFLFDPLQIQREEIGAETVGHTEFEARRRVPLVGAQNPAAAFLAHIPFRIGIAQHGMLQPARLAVGDQRRIRLSHDELMLDRNRGRFDPQKPRRALRVIARGGHDMFGGDDDLLVGWHKVAALFHHLGAGHLPFGPGPVIGVGLPFALDHHAALPRALGHGHRDVGRIDIAIRGVIDRAFQILGPHQGPAVLDLGGCHPFIGHAAGLGRGGIDHVFVHPRLCLRHPQVADDGKARVQAGFGLQRLVELDRIFVDMGGRKGHVEQRQQPRRMPCRARCQLVAFQQHHILPAGACQMIGDRGAYRAATDDQSFDMCFHGACDSLGSSVGRSIAVTEMRV